MWLVTIFLAAFLMVFLKQMLIGLLEMLPFGVWPFTSLNRKVRKHRTHTPYQRFHLNEKGLKEDPKAAELAKALQGGYVDQRFDAYYQTLAEDHLPLTVLVNWTKSIAAELVSAVSPSHYVKRLDQDLRGGFGLPDVSDPDYVEFEDYELAYLWGAVYYWLKCLTPGFDNPELLQYIEQKACPKGYLRPYFQYLKCKSEGIDADDYVPAVISGESRQKHIDAGPACCLLLGVSLLTEDTTNKSALEQVVAKLSGNAVTYVHTLIMGRPAAKHKEAAAKMVEAAMPKLADRIRRL